MADSSHKMVQRTWVNPAIVIGVIIIIGGLIGRELEQERSSPEISLTMNDELVKAAQEVNKNAPMKVDDETILVRAMTTEREITYFMIMTVAIPKQQLNALQAEVQKQNKSNICGNPSLRKAIESGATITHHYTDANEVPFSTNVAKC